MTRAKWIHTLILILKKSLYWLDLILRTGVVMLSWKRYSCFAKTCTCIVWDTLHVFLNVFYFYFTPRFATLNITGTPKNSLRLCLILWEGKRYVNTKGVMMSNCSSKILCSLMFKQWLNWMFLRSSFRLIIKSFIIMHPHESCPRLSLGNE